MAVKMERKYVEFVGNSAKNHQGGIQAIKKNIESKCIRYYSQIDGYGLVDLYFE